MYLIMVISALVFLFFGLKLHFEEDITKLLPSSSVESQLAFSSIQLKDKIYIQVTSADERLEPEILAERTDEFIGLLYERDSANHFISNVLYNNIPWVRFDYGRYSPTDSPLMVLERFSVSGPFFLASLNGESSYFRAVYDLQRCRLLFVTENMRNNTRAERAGIPYELDGQTLFLWPEFAARDLLICRNVHTADNYYCFRLKK